MTRGEALRTYLLTDVDISTTVGGTRIHPPPVRPKDTFPAITFHEVAGREIESHDGPSGLYQCRLQVNCWDKGYDEADNLREAVKIKLLNYAGAAGIFTIQGVNHAGDRYFYDGPNLLHQCVVEFWIWWEK